MCKVCFSRTFRCSRETALRRNMSQQEWFCCKHQFFCTTDTIRLPALPLRLNVDRVIRPLARSFRRVASPGQYAFSLWLFSCRCDSSYWDGRRPAGFLKGGSPALCSQFRVGALRHADAQSACLRGMRRTSICKSVRFRSAYNSSWLSLRESCRRRRLRGSAACCPLRPRCARPPLPKGEARSWLLLGFSFSLFLPHFFFVRSLLLPLFQYILFPLALIFLLEEHGLLQRGMEALDGKLL